jgi:hypothetical protein
MKQLMLIISMMVLLTNCTSRFDGFDPTTSMVRWIIQHDAKQNLNIEKDELQVKKNAKR